MPTVTGTILLPDGTAPTGCTVRFTLSGVDRAFHGTDETRVSGVDVAVDADTGVYTVTLPGNADLRPTGTYWNRAVTGSRVVAFNDDLLVPASGGPYDEEDILADVLDPLPETEPSNEVDSVERTTDFGPVTASNGVNAVPVTGMVVEVPDVDQPCWIEAKAMMRIANADTPAVATVAIGPEGSSEAQVDALDDISTVFIGAAGDLPLDNTGRASIRVPANTPGTYQMYLLAHDNTNIGLGISSPVAVTLIADDHVKASMRVLAV